MLMYYAPFIISNDCCSAITLDFIRNIILLYSAATVTGATSTKLTNHKAELFIQYLFQIFIINVILHIRSFSPAMRPCRWESYNSP